MNPAIDDAFQALDKLTGGIRSGDVSPVRGILQTLYDQAYEDARYDIANHSYYSGDDA